MILYPLGELTRIIGQPPKELAAKLLGKLGEVHLIPSVATEALEKAKDPNCSVREFARVVERDIKLASDVLSMANSVLYSNGHPVANLTQAVARLGFRHCRNLILSTSINSLLKTISLEDEWLRDVLWRHSYQTGLLAVSLNKAFNLGFVGEEFTGGLIHDFGRLLLSIVTGQKFKKADDLSFFEPAELCSQEASILGTSHCQFAGWFLLQRDLPPELIEVAYFHHHPEKALMTTRLTHLISLADDMANYLQRTGEAEGYIPSENPYLHSASNSGLQVPVNQFEEMAHTIMDQTLVEFEKICVDQY